MQQLSAPEDLTEYLRVTGIGVWFVLSGIIVLMAGILIWGMFGTIISSVTVPAKVTGGTADCYTLTSDLDISDEEIEIRIGDMIMTAAASEAEPVTLDASLDQELYQSGYLSPGKNAVILKCSTDLKDGFYNAVVTTEKIKPVSLLFGKK